MISLSQPPQSSSLSPTGMAHRLKTSSSEHQTNVVSFLQSYGEGATDLTLLMQAFLWPPTPSPSPSTPPTSGISSPPCHPLPFPSLCPPLPPPSPTSWSSLTQARWSARASRSWSRCRMSPRCWASPWEIARLASGGRRLSRRKGEKRR